MEERDPFEDAEYVAKQYLDIDDDEESPLGADIFRDMFGYSVEDVLEADEDEALEEDNSINLQDEDENWFSTETGVHIHIKPGQSKEEALKSFIEK